MKVKDRLSLQFTFMFAILLMVVLSGIYVLAAGNRSDAFFDKLEDRALTAGQLYLAQDNMSEESFNKVIKKFPQSLPHEVIRIYNDKNQPVFIKEDSVHWSPEIIERVVREKKVRFTEDNKQVAGLYYIDNSGNFVVLASAVDDSGFQNMRQLLWIMVFFFFISLIITFSLGRFFATIALRPIAQIIGNMKIIRATSLDKRLPVGKYRNDEITQLSLTINELLEHLEQSFSAQQAFIANASHELRTPLTAIMGNAEITLRSDREKEVYKNTLKEIVKDVEDLNQIINSLFELSNANMEGFTIETIRLDELLWEAADECGSKLKNNSVKYTAPQYGYKYTMQGSRRLLFIAFSNILNNAVKFSNGSDVICKLDMDERNIVVTIKDNGIGISPSDLAKIFQPFYRASNSQGYPGSGIGLSLADKIIRLHNGHIEVKSDVAKGTEFNVIFSR
jgi:signal transduction histidine kinase